VTGSVTEAIRCPRCDAPLDVRAPVIVCAGCAHAYPRLGRIPLIVSDPAAYLSSCRRQLALFEAQAELTVRVVEEGARAPGLLPLAKARCDGIIEAVRGQVADVVAILQPVVGAPTSGTTTGVNDDFPSPLKYIHNLYRDWGWPAEPEGENEQALAAVEFVRDEQSLGRTLVLGAGACRLAYDLQHLDPEAETLVVDVDPLLFTVAQQVVSGGRLKLREANAEIDGIDRVVKEGTLAAPHGALPDGRFHFLLAGGLEPPLLPGMFDTVLTPWFIDLIPKDLRDFISTVHTLLKPGGRWLSLGPLRYTSDLPVSRRFTRDELFDLARRAGFEVGRWRAGTVPYLVSKLSGRGKEEWVLTFAATKREGLPGETDADDHPPAWILFWHLPIPTWPGQSVLVAGDPLSQLVVSAIDGRRTLEDVTRLVASKIVKAGVPAGELRNAIRQFLFATHPRCQHRAKL
jgi:SAM-dependent methyltransferase